MLDVITGLALQPVQKSALCPPLNLGCSQPGMQEESRKTRCVDSPISQPWCPSPDIRGPQGTSEITLQLGFLVATS